MPQVQVGNCFIFPRLSDDDWSRLTMPLLFIGGEQDRFASPLKLQEMKSKCPHAEIWSVPGGSHRPHMPTEQVQEVNARMLAFFDEYERNRRAPNSGYD